MRAARSPSTRLVASILTQERDRTPARSAPLVTNLRLRASYRLAALLAAAHAAAGASLLFLDGLPLLRLVIAGGVAVSLIVTVRRTALLRTRHAITALEWSDDGAVSFQTRDGLWQAARLLPSTFVTPALTVINLRTVAERPRVLHVVLMADSAGTDEYRQLRSRLQWARTGFA